MKNVHALSHAAPPIASPGLFKRILYWILDWDDEATLQEGIRRMRSRPGFLDSLTTEQIESLRYYDGPEVLGPPLTRRERRDRERRLASARAGLDAQRAT
jgi:hypothetical protein